jgi:hypothetical protein
VGTDGVTEATGAAEVHVAAAPGGGPGATEGAQLTEIARSEEKMRVGITATSVSSDPLVT